MYEVHKDHPSAFDLLIATTVGQVGEAHTEELIVSGEALELVVTIEALYILSKIVNRNEVHQMGENATTGVYQRYRLL